MHKLETAEFMKTLFDTYLSVHVVLSHLGSEEVQKEISDRYLEEAFVRLDGVRLEAENSDVTEKYKPQITRDMERRAKEVAQDMPLILVNQNLVMMCTVFEGFMVNVLHCIVTSKPDTLLKVIPKKVIAVEKVLEAAGKEEILDCFRKEVEHRFSRAGIKEKFATLEKLGVSPDEVFKDFIPQEEPGQSAHKFDLEELISIFEKRHDIVHKRALPLQNARELKYVHLFFGALMVRLNAIVTEKFQVTTDLPPDGVQNGKVVVRGKLRRKGDPG